MRRPTQRRPLLYFLPQGEDQGQHMIWGMSKKPKYLAPALPTNTTMVASRDTSMEITKELPSVAMVKGWPQRGTKNHIQP